MVSTKEKFILVPFRLIGHDDARMIILTNYHFWSAHEKELKQWCNENNSIFVGMTVTFPDDKTFTIFALKWA